MLRTQHPLRSISLPALALAAMLAAASAPSLAQRSTPVTVVNPDPLPVTTDADRNARRPYGETVIAAFGTFTGIPTSDRVAGDQLTVPAGFILVIEHISLRATMSNTDQIGFVEARFTSSGSPNSHALEVRTNVQPLPVGTAQKIVNHNWPVKIYADPGTNVVLNLNSNAGSPTGSARYTVSGYLVPATSATLGQ